MTHPADLPEINAALFWHLTEPDLLHRSLDGHAGTTPALITDDPGLLTDISPARRLSPAEFGLDVLPIDTSEVLQRLTDRLADLPGIDSLLIDMGWSLIATMGVAAIENWGMVAEQIAAELGLTVVSLYDRERLIEEQLQAAFRAHQQFLAPSGLYDNPYWIPRELLAESTLDEQLGFMLGRVVPDFAGKPFFRVFDRAAARGAAPRWLAASRPALARTDPSLRWHVQCLGPLRVTIGGQHVVDWRTDGGAPNKTRTLFAYLLTKGDKGAHADQIGELLWPDRGTETSKRARLHHTVAMLRKALGQPEAVQRVGDYYRLNAPPGSWTDLPVFEQLCRRGLSLARAGRDDAALRLYDEAERLYGGDLFEDLPQDYVASEAEDWVLPRRTWLREMATRLQYDLAKVLRRCRRLAEALEHAQKAVAIDPANESAHAEVLRVFHAMGRTDAMHRQFRQYRATLAALGEGKEGVEIRAVYDELCRSLDRLTLGQRKTKELVLR